MLNELYDLAQSLESVHVLLTSWHTHFRSCPKRTATYFALLDESGRLADLEPIEDRDRLACIRKWEVADGFSFPAFNVLPLFMPSTEEGRKDAAEFRKSLSSETPPDSAEARKRLDSLVAASNSLWGDNELAQYTKCLITLATDVGNRLGTPPDEFRSIAELISRSGKLTAESLHAQLASRLIAKIADARGLGQDWFDALFFHRGKKPKKSSLILEVADRSAFPYPASHERVQQWMNLRFESNDGDSANVPDAASSKGAYGEPARGIGAKFPKVSLPILGNVILRAMSKEIPCQRRYGAIDGASCPVGHSTRKSIKSAFEWLGKPERKDQTWADARGICGYAKRDGKKVPIPALLFAYPSKLPSVPPELAGLIVGLESETDPDGARFQACASRVTQALKAQTGDALDVEIRVFAMKKADKARTKLIQACAMSARHLVESAREWQIAAANIPPLKVRQFGPNKGDKPFWADPFIPFPAEVVLCLNTAWERSGTHAEQVPGFGIDDGLGLLLERGVASTTIATRAARSLVVNCVSLLLALGQAHHQGLAHPMAKKYGKQVLLLPSIFGLLLAKLGRPKGEYMKGPPFLVGRLMSLADQLHVQYCHGVRKGQIPPQLVGNALMPTALEQPRKAVDLLAQRILPYQAWARTVQANEKDADEAKKTVRLAKFFLGELGRLSAELKELELPGSSADGDKAEMLLGYLAWSEKDKNPATAPSNPQGAST
jgi:hypothetical protein